MFRHGILVYTGQLWDHIWMSQNDPKHSPMGLNQDLGARKLSPMIMLVCECTPESCSVPILFPEGKKQCRVPQLCRTGGAGVGEPCGLPLGADSMPSAAPGWENPLVTAPAELPSFVLFQGDGERAGRRPDQDTHLTCFLNWACLKFFLSHPFI